MRKAFRLCLALVAPVLFAVVLVRAQSPEVLTNDSIVKMVQAKIADRVIVEQIRSSPNQFNLTTNGLVQLAKAGVSPDVMAAMQASSKSPAAPSVRSAARPATETAAGTANSEWVIPAGTKLDGTAPVEATATFQLEAGAQVRGTAACGLDPSTAQMNAIPSMGNSMMQSIVNSLDEHGPKVTAFGNNMSLDARMMTITLKYLPQRGSGLSLQATAVPQSVTPNAFGNGATISAPRSCVQMRIAVDQAQYSTGSSSCDFANVASFDFASFTPQEMAKAMSSTGPGGTNPIGKVISGMASGFVGAAGLDYPLMKQAFQAKALTFLLPLTNGESVSVRIEPQRQSFQQFVSKCLAVFPDPPVKVVPSASSVTAAKPEPIPLEYRPERAPVFEGSADKFMAELRQTIAKAPPKAHAGNHDFSKGFDVIAQSLKCEQQELTNKTRGRCHLGLRILADSFIDESDGKRTETNLHYSVIPGASYQSVRLSVTLDGTVQDAAGKRQFVYPVLTGTIK